jgi:hypothetical protein
MSLTTYIAGSIADMHSHLVDVGENVPKEEEAFLKVEDTPILLRHHFHIKSVNFALNAASQKTCGTSNPIFWYIILHLSFYPLLHIG